MSPLWRRTAAILRKDILIETRTRQGFSAMVSFAALVLFLATFVFNTLAEVVRQRLRMKYSSL